VDFDELYRLDPPFHENDGRLCSYRSSRDCCLYVYHHVSPTMRTIETGCGFSTVCFAVKGSHHLCIEPDADVIRRVQEFCALKGISLEHCHFVNERSEVYLPSMPHGGMVDFALIDGRHAFPTPFLDWFYIADRMRTGSIVVVDDTQLWTGKTLADFLRAEEGWNNGLELGIDRVRSEVFAKTTDDRCRDKWWGEQPFVKSQSVTGAV